MSGRVSPLCKINYLTFSVHLQVLTRATQPSKCHTRSITTTRPFLAVETGDDTSTENSWKIRLNGRPRSHIPDATHLDPLRKQTQVVPVRCTELLVPNRNTNGSKTFKNFTDQVVSISGRIRTIRKQKHGAFAHVTDGSSLQPIQVVLKPELAAPYVFPESNSFVALLTIHLETREWNVFADRRRMESFAGQGTVA